MCIVERWHILLKFTRFDTMIILQNVGNFVSSLIDLSFIFYYFFMSFISSQYLACLVFILNLPV